MRYLRKKHSKAALLLITFTLVAAACGSDDEGDAATTTTAAPATTAAEAPSTTATPAEPTATTEAPPPEPEDPRGTTLTYSYSQEPPNWDYTETGLTAVTAPLLLNVWETLVRLEADGSLVPVLAESWGRQHRRSHRHSSTCVRASNSTMDPISPQPTLCIR